MAGALVGGAFLSAFLQVAFDRLASRDILDYFHGRKLNETLLKKLKIKLLAINEVIDDAEAKEITSPNVKAWVDEVKDAVFDAEDLLDQIDYEVTKRKQEEAEIQTSCCKVRSFFTASASSFDKKIETRMKQVLENLEYLAIQKDTLGLKKAGGVGDGLGRRVSDRLPSTSLVDEADIYGRDGDKEIVVNWLLSHRENEKRLSIISIVGMGGLGKTTLAQLIYNDERMKDEFDLEVWVCVSEEFDVMRVTKTILEAITLSIEDMKDRNLLQIKLKEKLSGKKFLLVLDDVWNENHMHWEDLQIPFNVGAQGSKILVTTRNEKVASTMHSTKVHKLKHLLEDDSWLLFAKHAFHDRDPQSNPGLEDIGRKIINKCKGLPLALKTIGSLLYTKLSFEEWDNILSSEIWDISTNESNILPALRLSYYYLPSHLKRCFAYCSFLPKDYKFEKMFLVELWNAENLLHGHKNKSIKEIGDEYFHDLRSRSFFQQSSKNGTCFIMHDLVNDLAKHVSGEFSFCLDIEETQIVSPKMRYFSFLCNFTQPSRRFEIIYEADRLRTFLSLTTLQYQDHEPGKWARYIPRMIVENLLSRCKSLRFLSLLGYLNITELPDSLGNLKLLRYLDLSYTNIKGLPNSLCLLFNLQTLKLRYCKNLERLPSDLHKLINLHHLDFYGTRVRKMPEELGKLKNLQVLTSFFVGKCSKTDIKQLGELNLEGTLSVLELQNVAYSTDAVAANLKNKIHLEELSLEWSMKNDESEEVRDVLENLQPPKNIKKLCISWYAGTRFPNWLTDCSLSKLMFLELRSCKYCFSLPPLGILPSLKTLEIEGLEGLVVIGPEFYGDGSCTIPFRSLQILKFNNMENWEEWECRTVSGASPRLQELYIEKCPMLKGHLPETIASLRKLVICNCQQLVPSLPLTSELIFLKMRGSFGDGAFSDEIESIVSNNTNWQNMELPLRHRRDFLGCVDISGCNSLRSFPLDLFPSLQDLTLWDCSNLEMVSVSDGHHQNPTALKQLRIWSCPKFVSFPKVGLSKLEWCTLVRLDNLKALPECMAILLPSLLFLRIDDCPQLESFREGSLPSNLIDLWIVDCPKVTASIMKWGLHHHKSLLHLFFGDENIQSFPDQGLLPPSLTYLDLTSCGNLTRLDYKGLCHLSSLKELHLGNVPRLECLPEEGLPNSLCTLEIEGSCTLLKERCQKEKGKDWGKIAHIPCIIIDKDIIN